VTIKEQRKKVEQEPCSCVRCDMCNGTGRIADRQSWSGLDYEPCEDCSNGIVETCDRCQLLEDMDSDDNFDRWLGGGV